MAKPYTDYIHPVPSFPTMKGGIHKTDCHPLSIIKMAIMSELVRRKQVFSGSSKAIERFGKSINLNPLKLRKRIGVMSRWENGNR